MLEYNQYRIEHEWSVGIYISYKHIWMYMQEVLHTAHNTRTILVTKKKAICKIYL